MLWHRCLDTRQSPDVLTVEVDVHVPPDCPAWVPDPPLECGQLVGEPVEQTGDRRRSEVFDMELPLGQAAEGYRAMD